MKIAVLASRLSRECFDDLEGALLVDIGSFGADDVWQEDALALLNNFQPDNVIIDLLNERGAVSVDGEALFDSDDHLATVVVAVSDFVAAITRGAPGVTLWLHAAWLTARNDEGRLNRGRSAEIANTNSRLARYLREVHVLTPEFVPLAIDVESLTFPSGSQIDQPSEARRQAVKHAVATSVSVADPFRVPHGLIAAPSGIVAARPIPSHPINDDVTLVSPWYPTASNRFVGSYVADHARVTSSFANTVGVVHPWEWPGGNVGQARQQAKSVAALLQRSAAHGALAAIGSVGPVRSVPVASVRGASIAQRAEASVAALAHAIGRFDSPIVHGHVGYIGGLVAARLASPESKVFSTEHSTALRLMLDQPETRDHYGEVFDRAEKVIAVSEVLADQLRDAFPDRLDQIKVVPNPVRLDGLPRRGVPPRVLNRIAYSGALITRKGVVRMFAAFVGIAAINPDAELSLFGDGPLRPRLEQMASEAAIAHRVHFRGVVPHDQLLAELPRFDLLMHMSRYETFGLSMLEATVAGVPVIVTACGGPEETYSDYMNDVGRMVSVNGSAEEVVVAYEELAASLDVLDFDKARKLIEERFSPRAVGRLLVEVYGLSGTSSPATLARDSLGAMPREVIVLVSNRGRRQAINEMLESGNAANIAVRIATADSELVAEFGKSGTSLDLRPQQPTGLSRLRSRVDAKLGGRLKSVASPMERIATVAAGGDSMLILGDVQSAATMTELLVLAPDARLGFDIPRGGPMGPFPDGG